MSLVIQASRRLSSSVRFPDNPHTHPPTLRPTELDIYRELRMVQPLIVADVHKLYMQESSRFSITPTPHLRLRTQQPPPKSG